MKKNPIRISVDDTGRICHIVDSNGHTHCILPGDPIYLNGERVENLIINRNNTDKVNESRTEEETTTIREYNETITLDTFRKEPSIDRALNVYSYSLKKLKARVDLFITSCFMLYYRGYFGIPQDKIVDERLKEFEAEYPDFKTKCDPDKEEDRCLNFINYVQNVFLQDTPDHYVCDLYIITVLIIFIRTTYLPKNRRNVFDTFITYVFRPAIASNVYKFGVYGKQSCDQYGYTFLLQKSIFECKGILPDEDITKMLCNVIWIQKYHRNVARGSDFYKSVEKIIREYKSKNEFIHIGYLPGGNDGDYASSTIPPGEIG